MKLQRLFVCSCTKSQIHSVISISKPPISYSSLPWQDNGRNKNLTDYIIISL